MGLYGLCAPSMRMSKAARVVDVNSELLVQGNIAHFRVQFQTATIQSIQSHFTVDNYYH
jgi:hypothetical protein